MADELEENFLKANVFQKIAAAFIVAVAAVVTTLISLSFHSQSQKLKNELSNKEVELSNKEVELNHAYNLLTKLKKELNDTKEQLELANDFGERLANEEDELIKIYNLQITQLKEELSNKEGEIQRLRQELVPLKENSETITKIHSVK